MLVEAKRIEKAGATIDARIGCCILTEICRLPIGWIGTVEVAPARATTASYERAVLVAVHEEDGFVLMEKFTGRRGVVV